MRALRRAAYLASVELAKEKGAFPLFDTRRVSGRRDASASWTKTCAQPSPRNGIRNALLTSIAPTGTISLFADNVSSGLEPVFSFTYTRNMLMPDGSRAERGSQRLRLPPVPPPARARPRRCPTISSMRSSCRPAITWSMQAAVQKYIDSSISKTINCPEDLSFEAFKDVYLQAYELGCKGCTTYRPNAITGAVLEVKDGKKAESPQQAELPLRRRPAAAEGHVRGRRRDLHDPPARPARGAAGPAPTSCAGPRASTPSTSRSTTSIQDGRRRPFEIFINSKNMEHYAWTVGLTRMISAVFRRGGDVSFVVEELKAVFDPRGGQWMDGRYVPSLLAAIGEVIERHMIDIGFMTDPRREQRELVAQLERKVVNLNSQDATDARLPRCPKCSQPALIRQEGCDLCTSCGYSKCG